LFKERETYTKIQWQQYVNTELAKLLVHAYNNVPYYRHVFKTKGLTPDNLANFSEDDLAKIPFLEKDALRVYGKSTLLAKNLEKNGEFYASSGSTGTPTSILFSEAMHQKWSAAFECRIRNWAGLSISNARGMIGGRRIIKEADAPPPYYRYNYFEKQVYFSAYHIKPSGVKNYVNGIRKHHVEYMTGYAVSNYLLAKMILELGLKAPKLKAVITSSEKLTQEMRDTFKKVYGCKTFDSYSGVEACGLISECEFGRLHISLDVGIIEIIKHDGTHAKPGETGEAICTGLLNYDQPLIRYRIGDMLTLDANQNCNCGRKLPVVKEIIGRLEDVVIGPDGRAMVRFHGIFVDLPEVIEGQIIQHTKIDFEIKVCCNYALSAKSDELIRKRMHSQLGEINLTINQVNFIERGSNGKFKAVISHVKN